MPTPLGLPTIRKRTLRDICNKPWPLPQLLKPKPARQRLPDPFNPPPAIIISTLVPWSERKKIDKEISEHLEILRDLAAERELEDLYEVAKGIAAFYQPLHKKDKEEEIV